MVATLRTMAGVEVPSIVDGMVVWVAASIAGPVRHLLTDGLHKLVGSILSRGTSHSE